MSPLAPHAFLGMPYIFLSRNTQIRKTSTLKMTIINKLEFLVDNIFVVFGEKVF